ncbi:MAG TPA: glucan biosynthesis protein G [Rhodocyclaceae bacterium]
MTPLRLAGSLLLGIAALLAAPAAQGFGFGDVARRAQALSEEAFVKPASELPKELQQLKYEDYKDIRYKPDRMWWRGQDLPFELAFFHEGLYFDQPVRISEIDAAGVREIRYRPDAFDFGANKVDPASWHGLGFAGFRVHYAVNEPKVKDEVLAFLGASYFRALGRGQEYGLSARGLAIDTGLASGEEFPRFVEFWIQKPARGDRQLTIYALLDSSRAAGAYRFVLKPGIETALDVKARFYFRAAVGKAGFAPLSSMYYFGANQHADHDDYRPQTHDSDGLAIAAGNGEWIWRPLVNPKRLLVTSFAMSDPRGFGLQQRDRNFDSYQDLAARYDLRPGAWIEPRGKWGAGRVELVQLPTPDETNDNIAAYWVPDKPPEPHRPWDLEYRLSWQKDTEQRPPLLWALRTLRGRGYMPKPDDSLWLQVDFVGRAPPPRRPDEMKEAVYVDGNAELLQTRVERNTITGGWRLVIRFHRIDAAKPVELRAYLHRDNVAVSETWSYILPPD